MSQGCTKPSLGSRHLLARFLEMLCTQSAEQLCTSGSHHPQLDEPLGAKPGLAEG